MPVLIRLKRRTDFLRVARARCKWVMPGLILQASPIRDGQPALRVGFTVSRQVGNAVQRNRVRRRLRAVAAAVLPEEVQEGYDLVLIGRIQTLQCLYADLLTDLKVAARRLGLSQQNGRDDVWHAQRSQDG